MGFKRSRRFELNRFRLAAALAFTAVALAAGAAQVRASAEIHKFSLVLSAIPSSVNGGDLNNQIENVNRVHLEPKGLEGVNKIQFAWMYDAELHYFVRSNVAVGVGVGQIHTSQKSEYLPAIRQDIQIRAELLSVPIHLGADYYFTPYNQGDFQARGYLGGGAIAAVGNKALMEQVEVGTDTLTSLGGNFTVAEIRDSPGYYIEGGVHMFFASHLSVMLGAQYRSIVVRGMLDRATYLPAYAPDGKQFTFDASGIGFRMAAGIGF
jgi:hypothetical protein